jgi:sec-independent protein translocase protein TatC
MSRPEALPRMSFGEHLEELRRRLFRSVFAWTAATVVAFSFYKRIVAVATLPHYRARGLFDIPPEQWRFISTDYLGTPTAILQLTLLVGLFGASPLIGWQAWRFVGAGLYPRERRWVLSFGLCSFLLFVAGCTAGYFVLIPYTLYGMASMLPFDLVQPAFDIASYLKLFMTLTVALGGVFQLPLIMAFLTRIGLVEPRAWGRWRRHGIVANVVLAAVLAPGDPVSLCAFAAPLLALYEAGALAARFCRGSAAPVLAAVS